MNTAAQYFQIGQNTPGGFQDPSKYPDVSRAFPSLRFASQDPLTNQFIQGRLFQTPDELQGVTTSLADFEAALKGTKAEADIDGHRLARVERCGEHGRAARAAESVHLHHRDVADTDGGGSWLAADRSEPGLCAIQRCPRHRQDSSALAPIDLKTAQQKLYDKNNKAAQDAVDAIGSEYPEPLSYRPRGSHW